LGDDNHWEREALNWLRWARTPGFDSYWYYRQTFFDDLVPSPKGCTLDLACGEGRVTRDLLQRGHRVVSVDAAYTLIRAASSADGRSEYVSGDASTLPFPDETFDLVVAYNCLMDVEDMPAAVAEASRVLRTGGCLAACTTHPLNDAGEFADSAPDAPFVIAGTYLGDRRRFDQRFHREGLQMHFSGWCYSFEAYAQALQAAGLAIDCLREPPASDEAINRFGASSLRWRRIPMFLMFRAIKLQANVRYVDLGKPVG
jgi:SAM-dependent methyltransferase